jgi:hypothetical protein
VGKNPGDYYALFWTHDLVQQKDLRVHFSKGKLNPAAPAKPGGANPPVYDTNIPGQIAAPLLLEDGRLAAFVVDRSRPGTMKLWISSDDGQTWPETDSHLIYLHDERALLTQGQEHIDFGEYWEDMAKWTFGHPAICSLGGNRLLLAWYAGVPGTLSIHWVRVTV